MGHFPEAFRTYPGAPLRRWVAEVPNNGLIRYLDIFNMERIAIVKPEALADVLVHNCYSFEKPRALRKGISRILGMGLFLAEGNVHQVGCGLTAAVLWVSMLLTVLQFQRKHLSPAFAFRHLKDLYPIFWAKSEELVTAVSQAAKLNDNSEVEVNSWASRAALDIIGVAGSKGFFPFYPPAAQF